MSEKSTVGYLAFENAYGRFLGFCLHHKHGVFITAAIILAISIMTIPFVGTEFTPDQDTGEMEIRFQLPVSTRAELTADTARKIVKVLYDKEKELLAEKRKGVAPDKEELAAISKKVKQNRGEL